MAVVCIVILCSLSVLLDAGEIVHELTATSGRHLPLGVSIEGRPIFAFEFGKNNDTTLLLLGGIHGDEQAAMSFADSLFHFLLTVPDNALRKHVVFVPRVNPDGAARKTRQNAHGVDINRNFPAQNFKQGSIGDRYYGGQMAGSEPETRFLIDLIGQINPDEILTIHSPLNCVNYDGPAQVWAKRLSLYLGLPVKQEIGYDTPGSFGSLYGKQKMLPVITLELPEKDDVWETYGFPLLFALDLLKIPTPATGDKVRIYVSKTEIRMAVSSGGRLVGIFPVAIGSRNQTPSRTMTIIRKKVLTERSVYGTRWIATDFRPSPTGGIIGIHGTDDPESIGKAVSAGCVRMFNEDVEKLYEWIEPPVQLVIDDQPLHLMVGDWMILFP